MVRFINRVLLNTLPLLPVFLSKPLIFIQQRIYRRKKHRYLTRIARRLQKHLARPLNILEVGALYGESARALSRYGRVLTVDIFDNSERKEIFLANIKGRRIEYMQGNSMDVLPNIEESFDFIFIDGSHHYTETRSDIRNAKNLLRDGGVLVGDDLDLTLDEVDAEYAYQHKEEDVVSDTKSGIQYHPGVTVAVAEEFGSSVAKLRHTYFALQKMGDMYKNFPL